MILLLLALQDSAATLPSPKMLAIDFDLARPRTPSPDPNEIIVMGRRIDRRLPVLPDLREDLFPKAETGLFGGAASITGEAKPLLGGVTSNRIMFNWKMKF